jgi:hypothetical protein
MEWENENLLPINLKLKELSNEITRDHTTTLHRAKTQAIKHHDANVITNRYVSRIEKLLMSYTSLSHAAKQVMNEDKDSKKLLGLSQVLDKWMLEAFTNIK